MRGSKAKRLMRQAQQLCRSIDIGPGDGYGQYRYLNNRTYWRRAVDKDGVPIKDPETGDFMLQPAKGQGTRVRLWKCGAMYRNLKKYGDTVLRNVHYKGA